MDVAVVAEDVVVAGLVVTDAVAGIVRQTATTRATKRRAAAFAGDAEATAADGVRTGVQWTTLLVLFLLEACHARCA
jgi:hypothetical protein